MDGVGAPCSPQNFGSFPKHLPVFLVISQPLRRSGSSRLGEIKWWGPKPLLSNTIFPVLNLGISRRSEEASKNLRERRDCPPASSSSPVPLQTQAAEQPETSLMHLLWQGVPCPQPPPGQTCPRRWAEGLPLQPATGQLSAEPQRATIILLTARGVFPDRWTRFLSLRIGKNLQSSKNGFQGALQVILKP